MQNLNQKFTLATLIYFFSVIAIFQIFKFVIVDNCLDRGGSFLEDEFMCSGLNGYISVMKLPRAFYWGVFLFVGLVSSISIALIYKSGDSKKESKI